MSADDWADLARLAEAATPGPWHMHEMSKVFVGNGNPRSLSTIVHMSADDLADLTDESASRERANAEFIAAANPATILRLIADLRGARAQADRILARRRTEAEAERDAVAQDLAQVAWEREQYKLGAEAASNDRVVLRARLAGVEDERDRMYAAAEPLAQAVAQVRRLTEASLTGLVDVRDLRAALAAPTDTAKDAS